jgi:hypothetical protein
MMITAIIRMGFINLNARMCGQMIWLCRFLYLAYFIFSN